MLLLQCSPSTDKAQQNQTMNNWINIFGTQQWYKEQPNEEVSLEGILQEVEIENGPASRTTAAFQFIDADQKMNLKVYAPKKHSVLKKLLTSKIALTGKVVDLNEEGFSKEIWINKIHVLQE